MLSPIRAPSRAAFRAALHLLASSAVILPAACFKFDASTEVEPRQERRLVAQGTLNAADGGVLEAAANGPAVRLSIPPGALSVDTQISIWVRFGDPRFPSIVSLIEVEPPGLALAMPAEIEVQYAELYEHALRTLAPEDRIELFSFLGEPGAALHHHATSRCDAKLNRVCAEIDHFATFVALHPEVTDLLYQPAGLVDPADPVLASLIQGRMRAAQGGTTGVRIGQGSLESFRSAPADQNLVVLHGLLGTPFQLASAGSFAPSDPFAGFNRDFQNVVVFQYPSGRGVRENANALYDALVSDHGPGFGCNVLAHSTGGLVVRYALERAHLDASRAGFRPGDAALSTIVDRVVFVGTPNQGAAQVRVMFRDLLAFAAESDQPFVRGILDVLPGPGSFVDSLNTSWVRPAARYYAIAGDVSGARSDGLVDVLSAVGVPAAWTRPDAHLVFSGPAYDHVALTAFAARTGVLEQGRIWFGKVPGNSAPVIASLRTPQGPRHGEVTLDFDLSDQNEDDCVVAAQFSVDGRAWRMATPLGSQIPVLYLGSAPAPGRSHVFRWDSAGDGVGLGGPARVLFRLLVTDGQALGVVGQTGWFTVAN